MYILDTICLGVDFIDVSCVTAHPDLCNYSILVNVNGRIYPYSLVVLIFGLRLEAQNYVWSIEVSSKLVGTKLVRVGVGFVVTLSEDQLGLRVIVLVIGGVRTTHTQTLTTLSLPCSLSSLSRTFTLSLPLFELVRTTPKEPPNVADQTNQGHHCDP